MTSDVFVLFFKILIYWLSADLSGWFRLMCKSRKTFDIMASTKSVFFRFRYAAWERGRGRRQSDRLASFLRYTHSLICLTTGPSEFYTVLPLSISRVLPFPKGHPVASPISLHLPVTSLLPSVFPSVMFQKAVHTQGTTNPVCLPSCSWCDRCRTLRCN
jgi:hypothetical protein